MGGLVKQNWANEVSGLSDSPLPEAQAGITDIVELADAYYGAAISLFKNVSRETPLNFAPARLCAIHAIELYLNAFLRHEGVLPKEIRKRMHNIADEAFATRLKLRRKTAEHLVQLTTRREYIIARYGPEMLAQQSELNRLTATLVEVATKARPHVLVSTND